MEIEKDDNLPSGYRILGSSNNWGVEEGKLCICVSDVSILPLSENDFYITAYGEGPQQIAEDIIELSRESGHEELDTLKAENEALKETIEVLQRQLEKERNENTVKSELAEDKEETVQGVYNNRDALDARTYSALSIIEHTKKPDPDPELYTNMNIIIARHNETVMENNRLRKRNNKLKQDFESVKGHLRCAQYKLDKYERDKPYSKILVDNHNGQILTFKDAKVSISSNGDVTVSGESVNNLLDTLKGLSEIAKKFKEWQDIVLKRVEANPDIFNEHIKEN